MSFPSEIETVVVGASARDLVAARRHAMAGADVVPGRPAATAELRAWRTEAVA